MKLKTICQLSLLSSLILSFSALAQTTQINTVTSETLHDKPAVEVKTPADDELITKTIKDLISQSTVLSPLNVEVRSQHGVVKLSGILDSDSQLSTLVELAQSVVGVKDVNTSHVTVKDSAQPMTDALITAKVKGRFIQEKVFGDQDIAAVNISVETKNGVVYLTGAVNNDEQIKNAIKIAGEVKGVKKVEYHVKKVEELNVNSQ